MTHVRQKRGTSARTTLVLGLTGVGLLFCILRVYRRHLDVFPGSNSPKDLEVDHEHLRHNDQQPSQRVAPVLNRDRSNGIANDRTNGSTDNERSVHPASDLQQPSDAAGLRQHPYHLLWGIQSTDDEKGRQRRSALRQTYLDDDKVCNWLEYMNANGHGIVPSADAVASNMHGSNSDGVPHNSTPLSYDACVMFYTFVVGADPSRSSPLRASTVSANRGTQSAGVPTREADVIHVDTKKRGKVAAAMQTFIQWYHHASRHPGTEDGGATIYVGCALDDTLIATDLLHRTLSNHTLQYSQPQNNQQTKATSPIQDTMFVTRFVMAQPKKKPRYWILSQDVVRSILPSKCVTVLFQPRSDASSDPIKLFAKRLQSCHPRPLQKITIPWQFSQFTMHDVPSPSLSSPLLQIDDDPAILLEDWPHLRLYMDQFAHTAWSKEMHDTSMIDTLQKLRIAFTDIPPPPHPWSKYQTALSIDDNSTNVTSSAAQPQQVIAISAKFGAHAKFAAAARKIARIIHSTCLFQESQIHTYDTFLPYMMDDMRFQQHLAFLNSTAAAMDNVNDNSHRNPYSGARGGGYWFWKPLLIQHHMRDLKDGDWIVYNDVDTHSHFQFLPQLVATMDDRNADFAMSKVEFAESEWVKRDVFIHFCEQDGGGKRATQQQHQHGASNQYYAAWLVLRKTPGTVQFIDEWVDAMAHYDWINDTPSKLHKELKQFQEHRHDQSILSLLMKCRFQEPRKQHFRWGMAVPSTQQVYMFDLGQSTVLSLKQIRA